MQKISRRAVLRGSVAAIGLPFLESWSGVDWVREEEARRAFLIYTPNGVIQKAWTPRGEGASWRPGPTLQPLESIRADVSIVSGLRRERVPGQIHGQASCCWLTSSAPDYVYQTPYPTNVSLDHVLADQAGGDCLYPTLALSCNDFTDNHESVYFDSVSWNSPSQAATAYRDPRVAFDRIFKVSGDAAAKGSILDAVAEDVGRLRRQLGGEDAHRVDEYLESVRSTERLIQTRERILSGAGPVEMQEPAGIPSRRGDYLRIMSELVCHAFAMDLTRVATLVVDPERWSSPRMFHGVFGTPQNHHMLTHDRSPDAIARVERIDRFHTEFFVDVVKRMKDMTSVAGRSVLSESVVLMGSGLGEGYNHSLHDLPVVFAGSAGGNLNLGQHVKTDGRPLADLWLSLLQAFGGEQKSFADSKGTIAGVLA